MSQPSPLPSPYEITRIAVALRGRAATKNPREVIREAIGLWFVAAYELEDAKRLKNLYDGLETYPTGDCAERAFAESIKDEEAWILTQSESVPKIAFGTREEDSKVMKWLATRGAEFKTFHGLERAWKKTFGEKASSYRSSCTASTLEKFMQMRAEERRMRDANRKRQKRNQKHSGEKPRKQKSKIAPGRRATDYRTKQ